MSFYQSVIRRLKEQLNGGLIASSDMVTCNIDVHNVPKEDFLSESDPYFRFYGLDVAAL